MRVGDKVVLKPEEVILSMYPDLDNTEINGYYYDMFGLRRGIRNDVKYGVICSVSNDSKSILFSNSYTGYNANPMELFKPYTTIKLKKLI